MEYPCMIDTQAICQGFAALGRILEVEVLPAFQALGVALQETAERDYLMAHRRLPGTLRTKRGRKKRRTMVAQWHDTNNTPHTL